MPGWSSPIRALPHSAVAVFSERQWLARRAAIIAARRIALGIADSEADIGSGELFPHEANLDQLGGVSFSKGCYVGQEVVSRMEHRGTARSRILPVTLDGPAPAKGTAIQAGDKADRHDAVVGGRAGARRCLRLDRLAEPPQRGPLLTEWCHGSCYQAAPGRGSNWCSTSGMRHGDLTVAHRT